MEAKKKKALKNKNFFLYLLFEILSFVCLFLPILILAYVKKDTYFHTEQEAVKVSIGFVIGVIFSILAIKQKLKAISPLISMGIIWILSHLLATIISDIIVIIPCVASGYLAYMLLQKLAKYYQDIHIVQRNAKIQEKAKIEIRKEETSVGNV